MMMMLTKVLVTMMMIMNDDANDGYDSDVGMNPNVNNDE